MFKMTKNAKYNWPVKIKLATDGGKFTEQKVDLVFKRLPQSEFDSKLKDIQEGKLLTKEFCKEIVVGWKDVQDESGNEVDFSDSALDELLEIPMAGLAISEEFFKSYTGSSVKN